MKVEEIMRREILTLSPYMTVAEAVRILAENNIGGAPVVEDDGTLVGLVTNADIFRSLRLKYKKFNIRFPDMGGGVRTVDFGSTVQYKEITKAFKEVADTKIEDIMITKVFTAAPDDHVEIVIPTLVDKKINRLPVVKDGRLIGILSRRDIIKALLLQIG